MKAAGRDKGLGGGARLPRCFAQSLPRSLGLGGLGLPPRSPLSRRLQPSPGSSGPPGLPQALNSAPPTTLGPPCPASARPRADQRGQSSPPRLSRSVPRSWAPSPAAQPGTGAGSPGRRFQGTVGEEEPAGPAARPPSRPEPARPPHRARAVPEPPPPPHRAHRPPEPARQAAEAETRHPAAPARSGLERSAAQRSAAPRSRASRTERELPAGGSGDKLPASLAAAGRASRTGHVGTGRCSGSPLSACERPAWNSCVHGAPEAAGHARGRHRALLERTGSSHGLRWTRVQEGAAQGSAVQGSIYLSLAGRIIPGWLCRCGHRALLDGATWLSPKQALPACPRWPRQNVFPKADTGLWLAWSKRALTQVGLPEGYTRAQETALRDAHLAPKPVQQC